MDLRHLNITEQKRLCLPGDSLAADVSCFRVDAPSGSYRCRLEGNPKGEVLVLCNSLGTDLSMWDFCAPQLLSHFRLLRFDRIGAGTSKHSGGVRIDDLGRDVCGILDRLSIENVSICGHAFGGLIGLWLGAFESRRIRRLVVSGVAERIGTPDFWKARIDRIRQHGLESTIPSIIERWFSPGFEVSRPRDYLFMMEMLRRTSEVEYVERCMAISDCDVSAYVSEILVPTLVIGARFDGACPADASRGLCKKLANARYIELAAAHMSPVECSDAYSYAICDFLSM